MRLRAAHLLAPTLLAIALATGCATTGGEPTPAQRSAGMLLDAGRHAEAARLLENAAADARGAQRSALLLDAADAWREAGEISRTRPLLAEINPRRFDDAGQLRHALLLAELALVDGRPAQARDLLDRQAAHVPTPLRGRWHRLRAAALASDDPFAAAAELARLEPLLPDASRAGNRRDIERLLARIGDRALAQSAASLPPGDPLYPHAGRALTQRGLPLPRAYERGDAPEAIAERPPADADGYRPPRRLALLLPLSGPLASAGSPVLDGALSAHYGESRRRPELHVYDTAGTPQGAIDAYQLAVGEGADQILGPLTREEVGALFSQPALPVPVLALNRANEPPPPGSASFALSPEDEGEAAAERLWQRGLRKVIVVAGNDDTALRSLATFRDRFRARGGEIVAETRLAERALDFNPQLAAALAAAGGPEGDHDAIFIALRAQQARLLVPQLAIAGFPSRPIIATSQVLVGGGDPRLDRELDGVEFPELPWLLGTRGELPEPARVERQLPGTRGGGARLYAFGLDAYRLTGYLQHLVRNASAWLNGATGELRIDAFGNVLRQPGWGVFSGGRARPALDGALTPDATTSAAATPDAEIAP